MTDMTLTTKEKNIIKVLEMIAQDQADDAKNFEGKPLTGKVVAEYFGNQGAAIATIAKILKYLIENQTMSLRDLGMVTATAACGNCHESWPCKCADPVWVCGICAGDQYQCECDERSYDTAVGAGSAKDEG